MSNALSWFDGGTTCRSRTGLCACPSCGVAVPVCPMHEWDKLRPDAPQRFDGAAADLEQGTCRDCGATFCRCLECKERGGAHLSTCEAAKLDAPEPVLFVAIPGESDPDYVRPPCRAPEGSSAEEEARCDAAVERWRAGLVRR